MRRSPRGQNLEHPVVESLRSVVEMELLPADDRQSERITGGGRAGLHSCLHLRTERIEDRPTVRQHDRGQVHEARDPLWDTVGDPGDHGSRVRVADEDDVAEVAFLEHGHDVVHMGREGRFGRPLVCALGQASKRDGANVMPTETKLGRDFRPCPCAEPGSGYEDECAHGLSPSVGASDGRARSLRCR